MRKLRALSALFAAVAVSGCSLESAGLQGGAGEGPIGGSTGGVDAGAFVDAAAITDATVVTDSASPSADATAANDAQSTHADAGGPQGGDSGGGGGGIDAGIGTDASSATDAAPLPPPVDAGANFDSSTVAGDGGCPGVICAGACLTATTCASCATAPILCRATNTCVNSCSGSSCSNGTTDRLIDCFACDSAGANPIGTCEPQSTAYCLRGDYSKAYQGGPGAHCSCAKGVTCPGANEVCSPAGGNSGGGKGQGQAPPPAAPNECFACGEDGGGTDGNNCTDPKLQCDSRAATCG